MKIMNGFFFKICVLACISVVYSTNVYDIPCGHCTCVASSASANCSNRNLKNIPTDLPANTTDLNLERNRIQIAGQSQPGLCQKYPELTKVSLAWNELEALEQILQGCKHLEHLDLSGNILALPNVKEFKDLENLQELSSIEVQELNAGIFQNLKKLETLNLTFYGITIQPGVFTGLLSLKDLTLTLEKVLSLPENLLSFNDGNVLKSLTIRGSKVKDIPDDLLETLVSLKKLHLDLPQLLELEIQESKKPKYLQVLEIYNVRSLAEDTLSGLQYLETVKLHGINSLAGEALFQSANTVKELEIVGCSLTELPAGWLHNMVALETLNLSENGLQKLNNADFLHLTSLQKVVLSNNKIRDLPSGFLDSQKNTLKQLYLNGNQVKKLVAASFTDLQLLEVLDLRRNTIRSIATNSLRNLPQLKVLRLSGNYISSLDNLIFQSFPMLREINLAENMISHIPETLLASKVVNLFLSANNLQILPGRKLCTMLSLQKLGLEDNPIFCDCSLRALHTCLPQLEVRGQCSRPADLEGRNIDDLTECLPPLVPTITTHFPSLNFNLQSSNPKLYESNPIVTHSLLESQHPNSIPHLMALMSAGSTNSTLNLMSLRMPLPSAVPSNQMVSPAVQNSSLNQKVFQHSSQSDSLTARPAAIHGPAGQNDVDYNNDDDKGHWEIVRQLIAKGISEKSEPVVTSTTEKPLVTQPAQIDSLISLQENISHVDGALNKSEVQLSNTTESFSPDMVQVPAMVEQEVVWSEAGDIITSIFIFVAVMTSIVVALWLYRKKSQSGSYNPVSSSRDVSQGNTIQMEPSVQVVPNEKLSNSTLETSHDAY